MQIVGCLEKAKYIECALKVFPEWEYVIPQGFWRTRWLNDHKQEAALLQGLLPTSEDLGWRPFYLYFNRGLAKSQAWVYRQQIMRRLQEVKSTFRTNSVRGVLWENKTLTGRFLRYD